MKITREQLQNIIKEELDTVLKEKSMHEGWFGNDSELTEEEKELSDKQKDKMDQDDDGDIDADDLKKLRDKKVSHSWATHGRKSSDKSKEIGEVVNHSLTEDGKIEFYEVKFKNGTEIVADSDFIVEASKMHEHEIRKI